MEHGPDVIALVRKKRPHEYLKLIAGLMPKQIESTAPRDIEQVSDEQLGEIVHQILAAGPRLNV